MKIVTTYPMVVLLLEILVHQKPLHTIQGGTNRTSIILPMDPGGGGGGRNRRALP